MNLRRAEEGRLLPRRWADGLRRRGVDGATVYATLGHITSLSLGPVTALFIAARLQPDIQGYYYTFGGLTSVQMLFGAGLNQVVMQVASHEWPHLRLGPSGSLGGREDALRRLGAVFSRALRWYVGLGLVLAAALVFLGWVVFSEQAARDGVGWMAPWLALTVLAFLNFALAPIWAVLQGCGQIRQYYQFHCVHLVLNALVLWASLSAGRALWSLPLATAAGIAWAAVFLAVKYRLFFRSLLSAPRGAFSWSHEIWPLQWRSWISSVSTTITVQALVPLLFRLSGPEDAGRLGMSITLAGVVAGIASNPVSTKAPMMGALVAQRRLRELDALYRRVVVTAAILLAFAATSALAALWLCSSIDFALVNRLLPPASFAAMLGAASGMAVAGWMAAYVRAFKREPFAMAYCCWSVATIVGVVIVSRQLGSPVVVEGYVTAVLAFFLPVTTWIFLKHKRRASAAGAMVQPGIVAAAGRAGLSTE